MNFSDIDTIDSCSNCGSFTIINFGGLGSVTLNNVMAFSFSGFVTLNESTLIGNINAFASAEDMINQRSPIFMVDFIGNGFRMTDERRHLFTVTNVPEPATLGLLGIGLAGVAARRHRRLKDRR